MPGRRSVFVADPARPGSGPGGTCILSAARLTGKGRCNLAAFVTLERPGGGRAGRQLLTSVDTTCNVSACNVQGSTALVASALKRLSQEAAEAEERLNLAQLGALQVHSRVAWCFGSSFEAPGPPD